MNKSGLREYRWVFSEYVTEFVKLASRLSLTDCTKSSVSNPTIPSRGKRDSAFKVAVKSRKGPLNQFRRSIFINRAYREGCKLKAEPKRFSPGPPQRRGTEIVENYKGCSQKKCVLNFKTCCSFRRKSLDGQVESWVCCVLISTALKSFPPVIPRSSLIATQWTQSIGTHSCGYYTDEHTTTDNKHRNINMQIDTVVTKVLSILSLLCKSWNHRRGRVGGWMARQGNNNVGLAPISLSLLL